MTIGNLGDRIYSLCSLHRGGLFELGELVQLAYSAFDLAAMRTPDGGESTVTIQYPLGFKADETTILGEMTYTQNQLIERYRRLGHFELPLTAVYHLVTRTETWLGDLVRNVIVAYPKKVGTARKLDLGTVLACDSLEAIHVAAADALLIELSYKSPRDFAESVQPILGISLLEIPAYHHFVELKGTRDVHVHNRGVTNNIYLHKVGSFARAKAGQWLPITTSYFLRSYEQCLQLSEAVQARLLETWSSPLFEEHNRQQVEDQNPSIAIKPVPPVITGSKPEGPSAPSTPEHHGHEVRSEA